MSGNIQNLTTNEASGNNETLDNKNLSSLEIFQLYMKAFRKEFESLKEQVQSNTKELELLAKAIEKIE